MPASVEALRRIFKEGLGSASKKELEHLFALKNRHLEKLGTQKLYRQDSAAEELMKTGFSPEQAKIPPLRSDLDEAHLIEIKGSPEAAREAVRRGLTSEEEDAIASRYFDLPWHSGEGHSSRDIELYKKSLYDEPGLYWTSDRRDLPSIAPPYHKKGPLIEGLLNPDAVVQSSSRVNPDFLLSGSTGTELGEHLIQKRGGNILARLGDTYKIIGLAGALGLGSQAIEPDEAEAGLFKDIIKHGIGLITKQTTKTATKRGAQELSSSVERLVGQSFQGKIIKDVRQGPQDWRYIIYDDGTEQAFKKDVINKLCREYGTIHYMEKLEAQDPEGKLIQATKALSNHISRQKLFTTQRMLNDYRRLYSAQLKELGMEPEPMSMIYSPIKAYIPDKYIKILEESGLVSTKPKKVP